MRGGTNASKFATDSISFVHTNGTIASGAKIPFQHNSAGVGGRHRDWCTLTNGTDFTLKKGYKYLVTYSATASTTDDLVQGFSSYSGNVVWRTHSYTSVIDLTEAPSDYTESLTNGGQPNTWVWFTLVITRLGGD